MPQIQKQLDEIADLLEKSVDLDGILEMAQLCERSEKTWKVNIIAEDTENQKVL